MKLHARVLLLLAVVLTAACQPAYPTPTEPPAGQVENQLPASIAARLSATAPINQTIVRTLDAAVPSLTIMPTDLVPAITTLASSIPSVPKSRVVVIDTDMAPDDWGAILYLLQRPDITVKAITVSGTGEAHCVPGIRNALGLIMLAGYDMVPVACGRETPVKGNHAFPDNWRQGADNLLDLTLPKGQNATSNPNAVELLTSTIQSSPQQVTLLTLGPLTNIADALQADPSLVDNIEMIYMMGGAVNVPGNIAVTGVGIDNQVAEWNIYIDPFAANVVLQSGVAVTLIPLDATNDVPLTTGFYERIKTSHATPEAAFIYDLYTNNYWLFSGGVYFWDQLSATILTDEELATYQTNNLCVIEEEGLESGRTVVDESCPIVRVAVSADRPKFEKVFLDTLNAQSLAVTSTRTSRTDMPTAKETLAIQPSTVSPTATQTPTNADAIVGTWSGTAQNGEFTFQVTVTIRKSCAVGSVCGSFDIPAIPCSGTFTLISVSGNTYQFQASNLQGSCTAQASDFLQLRSDGTLLYISRHPSYGESKGVLVKVDE